MKVNFLSLGAVCAFLLVGCGGSSSTPSSDSDSEATVLAGVFVDSAVEGATFATETQSGATNALGEFSYLAGEQVTFSVGLTQFPAATGAVQVSPVDIAASSSNPTATTTNIARLLQSLDEDGNPENGITIPVSAAAVSANIDFDVSTDDFENDPAVINLVANSGSVNTTLISAEAAMNHLNATLGLDRTIITLEDFTNTIVGKRLAMRNDDGSRDEEANITINSDGTAVGGDNGVQNLFLDWYWEDEYFCRSGVNGEASVPFDCQTVEIEGNVVSFRLDRGNGEISTRWFYE